MLRIVYDDPSETPIIRELFMSVTFIRRVIEVFIGLFILGIVIASVRAVASLVSGSFGTVSWPIASDLPQPVELASSGLLRWTHGRIVLTDQPFAHAFDLATGIGILVLLILAMLSLRKLLLAVAGGDPFTSANIAHLRKIGWLLIAVCIVSVFNAVVLQSIILSAAEAPQGIALHPSISWDVAGVENVWMDYTVPVWTFMLGALAFITAGAFQAGKDYREDSESVV